ncbi:hypothetical protein BU14_0742s0007 [Porphyra umbilicalis]|uniref:Uncharacterized protein n=1 Tax=Porphyra umbilicalis TaxID=2786 RepID=A0A1X6NPR4_PORUM|nr:hypothetical protein BU14_0742s0007 [Porphyra umbilicalis]|eukprot:OSX70486.1 hypothetical protein BU14_0742s0007 [Porphyra umbilicalis]
MDAATRTPTGRTAGRRGAPLVLAGTVHTQVSTRAGTRAAAGVPPPGCPPPPPHPRRGVQPPPPPKARAAKAPAARPGARPPRAGRPARRSQERSPLVARGRPPPARTGRLPGRPASLAGGCPLAVAAAAAAAADANPHRPAARHRRG